MPIERAAVQIVRKPWGATDLAPWSVVETRGDPVGELWFQRAAPGARLRLKILFTTEPLSVQVHPDDAVAREMGLDQGKTEAWHVLAAAPGARVALGLTAPVEAEALAAAIADGSIMDLLAWVPVGVGDTFMVPAGTIHAIGPGLVLAEIQQASDTTFRLYDHGRDRPLQIAAGVRAARGGPAACRGAGRRIDAMRDLLVACPQFVWERVVLPPLTPWTLAAPAEAWGLVIEGELRAGGVAIGVGQTAALSLGPVPVVPGAEGATLLIAYPGPEPIAALLAPRPPTRPVLVADALPRGVGA